MGRVTVAANFLYGLSLVLKDEVYKMKAQKAIAAFYKKNENNQIRFELGTGRFSKMLDQNKEKYLD